MNPQRMLLAGLVFVSLLTHAATFTVTTTNHSGAGSLRQAILDANASAGSDVRRIGLPPSTSFVKRRSASATEMSWCLARRSTSAGDVTL